MNETCPSPGRCFFDRSWYNRAVIEPTMGYSTESQYKYFMKKTLNREHKLMDKGLMLIKFYLSINEDTQLYRFDDRQKDDLKFWKFSRNDFQVRGKWDVITYYKNQMFNRTSSDTSPWVIVNANVKPECRLGCMLYAVRKLSPVEKKFKPFKFAKKHTSGKFRIIIDNVEFNNLSPAKYNTLKNVMQR